jgi:hypothetical protein
MARFAIATSQEQTHFEHHVWHDSRARDCMNEATFEAVDGSTKVKKQSHFIEEIAAFYGGRWYPTAGREARPALIRRSLRSAKQSHFM